MRIGLFIASLFFFGCAAIAQDNTTTPPVDLEVSESTRPTVELNPGSFSKKKKEEKQKRRKKNVFYGYKCKKKTIKIVKNGKVTFIRFYLLPDYEDPNPYAYAKYIYDSEKKDIVRVRSVSEGDGVPLHGKYERVYEGNVIERGYFYKGVKHGRWERYHQNGDLLDKTKWNKGFPKESVITSYPQDTRLIKEVIPIHYGKREGMYMSYYESGRLKEVGEYHEGEKIELWVEYYDIMQPNGYQRKKREVRHKKRKDVYKDIEPVVQRAWNENGEQTIKNLGRDK